MFGEREADKVAHKTLLNQTLDPILATVTSKFFAGAGILTWTIAYVTRIRQHTMVQFS